MVLFKSPNASLQYPTDVTTWEWLFESPSTSPLYKYPESELKGYVNAFTKESLNYAEVKEKAIRLSTVLVQKYGLQAHDTVSLFSTNTIWYPVAMWATIRVGGRVNGASPSFTVDEMVYSLRIAKSRFVLTVPPALDTVLQAAEIVGIPKSHVFLLEGHGPEGSEVRNIQDLIEEGASYTPSPTFRIPAGKTNKDICTYLNFSSGTTGLPKAVMLSSHQIIAQCMQHRQIQLDPEDYQILAVTPLYHVPGLVRFCTYPILLNGFSIMLPRYSLPAMLTAIVNFQVTEIILPPPVILRLVHDPIVSQFNLSHIRRWSVGSAPVPPEVIALLYKKFPTTGFRQGYGATETTGCISCHPPTHHDFKYGASGGMLLADTVAKVLSLNGDGRELGVGETGEIVSKGPQMAMGYLDNEAATRETFQDGWFHTGDVGYIDASGLIYVSDRLKEMIKVKGTQVAPAELEDLLLGHPDVEDVAVLGIPDPWAGERPKAFVVLKAGVAGDEEEGKKLLNYVREQRVRYKWIEEVEFVASIPKTPTGKILRRVLKEREREKRTLGVACGGFRVEEEARNLHSEVTAVVVAAA